MGLSQREEKHLSWADAEPNAQFSSSTTRAEPNAEIASGATRVEPSSQPPSSGVGDGPNVTPRSAAAVLNHQESPKGGALSEPSSGINSSKVQFRVYLSHTLSAWGDAMWLFAISVFLIELNPQSLRLTAAYGLVVSISIILCGEIIGRWIDRTQRLTASRTSLIGQNVAVILSAIFVGIEFGLRDEEGLVFGNEYVTGLFHVAVIFFANIASLGSIAAKICIEKDWVVVIAGDDNNNKLAKMNSIFRSIDLLTNILAPIAVGQIMAYISPIASAIFICGWNVVSVTMEYGLLYLIFKNIPELAHKVIPTIQEKKKSLMEHIKSYKEGWSLYFHHEIVWAGLSLATLYMTVLAFHSITIGYAYSQGISEGHAGIGMALGSIFGILGSTAFPSMVKCCGLYLVGMIGITIELAALLPTVVALWLPGSPFEIYTRGLERPVSNLTELEVYAQHVPGANSTALNVTSLPVTSSEAVTSSPAVLPTVVVEPTPVFTSIVVMLCGIIVSRFGLWVADLVVTQIIQEKTGEHERGVINGVQASLNMMMETLKFLLVIIIPKIPQFGYLVIASVSFICLGWVFFFIAWRKSTNISDKTTNKNQCQDYGYQNDAYA